MLPPPMTMAVWTPSPWISPTSRAMRVGDGRIDPELLVAHQRFAGQLQENALDTAGRAADIEAIIVRIQFRSYDRVHRTGTEPEPDVAIRAFPDPEPGEAADRDVLAGLGGRLRRRAGRRSSLPSRIERLVEQHELRVEAAELALDDLVEHVAPACPRSPSARDRCSFPSRSPRPARPRGAPTSGRRRRCASPTSLTRFWKSSVRATKSDSQFTSTRTPILPPMWM